MANQLQYDEVLNLATRKWEDEGASEAVAYVESVVTGVEGELRGRGLAFLAELKTRAGNKETALGCYLEACELIKTPEHLFTAYACAVDTCVEMNNQRQGHSFRNDALALLKSGVVIAPRWLGTYHMNSGRLLLVGGDYTSATSEFVAAEKYLRESGMAQAALNAELYLAESLLAIGHYEDALTVCRRVRTSASAKFVIYHLDALQSQIALLLGDLPNANRFASRVAVACSEKLGKQDMASTITLVAVACALEVKESGSVENLPVRVAKKIASLSQMDVSELMKGMIR